MTLKSWFVQHVLDSYAAFVRENSAAVLINYAVSKSVIESWGKT